MNSFIDQFQPYDYPLFGYVRLPVIKIIPEERTKAKAPDGCSNFDFLRALARQGFYKRIPKEKHEIYAARAKKELAMFDKLGFVDYVLLVWKTVNYCDINSIARDYGRGSAAGSLIFYLLEITDIDPLRYDLFFERFVSEARAKKKVIDGITYIDGSLAPDVDIDIEQTKRGQVVEHLKYLYPDRVCKISTLATLSGKSLIKECGKIVEELDEDAMKHVADMIPKRFGIVQDIAIAYKEVPKFQKWCDEHPRAYKTALKLRDIIKNKGSHPSGFVVSFDKISDFLPLELVNKSGGEEGKEPATSLTMEYVSQVTIKLDLLGVRCCSVVASVLKMTGAKIHDINIDSDPLIYDNLQNLICPHGIFQLEAPTNLQVNQKVKPKNLGELGDVVAIARPGALSYLKKYAERTGKQEHPLFDAILSTTRYVCLYQEQMMQLAAAIGFSLEEAEQLRRIVGKKKKEEIAAWEERVNDKIRENNLPEELGQTLWKILNESADYSFNKSHAISYAALAALTTYLKFRYPLEFYTALLRESKNEPKPLEEIRKIQGELRFFGIELLPPNLVKSGMEFEIEGRNIRFGLSSIKGVSEKTIQKLSAFKHEYSNKFELFEGANNAALSISVQSALIQSGCLDGVDETNPTRAKLTLEAHLWNVLLGKEKKWSLEYGGKYGYNLFKTMKFLREAKNDKGKPFIPEKRWGTIMKNYAPAKQVYELNSVNQALANHFYEKALLGYSYSSTLREVMDNIPDLMSVEEILNSEENDKVLFVGTVTEKVFEGTSQSEKKTRYARWTVADETGTITGLIFNSKDENRIEECKRINEDKLPTKDSIVLCKGRRKNDAVFLDSIRDLSIKIYTKYGDVKKELEKKKIDAQDKPE